MTTDAEEMDSRDVVRMQQILATETASATVDELESRSRDPRGSIEDHLHTLRDRGMVSESDGVYEVTECGVEWLEQRNLYEQIGILYDVYEAARDE